MVSARENALVTEGKRSSLVAPARPSLLQGRIASMRPLLCCGPDADAAPRGRQTLLLPEEEHLAVGMYDCQLSTSINVMLPNCNAKHVKFMSGTKHNSDSAICWNSA